MKMNVQFFAEARTNMVSLLDIGSLNGGATPNIVVLGNGFTEITEDWGPDVSSTQYINMDAKSSTVKGYALSIKASREYIADAVQTAMDTLFSTLPTGSKCETFYYRFLKSNTTTTSGSTTGPCIKVPVTVAPSSLGGSGGDVLVSELQISGNGNVIPGKITISSTGTYTFAATV